MDNIKLLTVNETAEFLRISERTLRRMDETGKVPLAVKLGRCKRWNKRELLLWVDYGSPPRVKWEPIWQELRSAV